MEKAEIINRAFEVFNIHPRPDKFTDHPGCCECAEHNETLSAATPQTIARTGLGTMSWDPITFTTPAAFRYYLPGLIRTVLTSRGDESYYEQFLWHMGKSSVAADMFAGFSGEEQQVVAACLDYLFENRITEIEQECLEDELLAAMELWCSRT